MIRIFVILILFILLCSCNSKRTEKRKIGEFRLGESVDAIVDSIASDNVFKGDAVGLGAQMPEQWVRFEKLKHNAKDSQLIKFTDHDNAVVRMYAFSALLERKEVDLYPVVQNHLNDTARVRTYFGCIVGEEVVGYFFARQFLSDTARRSSKLFNIDSIILYSKAIDWDVKDQLLLNFTDLSQKNYDRLKEIAFSENNDKAIVAMSKYQNQKDIATISEFLTSNNNEKINCGLLAVVNFPHQSFFPIIKKMVENELKNSGNDSINNSATLYRAIVQYRSKETRELFDKVLKDMKGELLVKHSDLIYQAVKENPNPVYVGLKYRHTYFTGKTGG